MQIFTDAHFDFIGRRRIAFLASGLVILAGIVSFIINGGFNLGIDFTGGVRVQVKFAEAISTDDLTKIRGGLDMDVYTQGTAADEVVIRNKVANTGEALAAAIVHRRDTVGHFTSFDELTQIDGFPAEYLGFFKENFDLDENPFAVTVGVETRPALNTADARVLATTIERMIERTTHTSISEVLSELRPPVGLPAGGSTAGLVNLNAPNSRSDYAKLLEPLMGIENAGLLADAFAGARNLGGIQTMRLLGDTAEVEQLARDAGLDSEAVNRLLAGSYLSGFEIQGVNVIGPKVGLELGTAAIYSVIAAMIGLLLYISLRFEFVFALGAIIALFHDVFVTLGIFSLLGKEINLAIIAAILTLIGYSLNDTIVVFDRIREDRKLLRRRTLEEIINKAINETLSRTILTSGTTLIVTLVLVLFGGSVIHDFALALTIGIIVGTYSSIFIAAPFVIGWYRMFKKAA
ncbi:MAG: protein translocase subunit SecF [bacterium]|nr:protein translocase subunit SecF [bacterium]